MTERKEIYALISFVFIFSYAFGQSIFDKVGIRIGFVLSIASVVSFLASKDAAFITAETIQVGGGQALGI